MALIQVDSVPSWGARLQTRVYEQFKADPTINAIATAVLGPQFDQLEAVFQQILSTTSISNGIGGVWLDLIGRVVGQPRAGASDANYQLYLQARIAARKSKGGPEDIYKVMRLLFGQSIVQQLIPGYPSPAAFEYRLSTPITDPQSAIGVGFLHDTKMAGVRGIFEWQEAVDSSMFFTAMATTVAVQNIGGATTLQVATLPAGFPSSGSITIDGGLANAETVAFTKTDATHLSVAALGQVHLVGAEVEQVGDTGLGFGDSNNGATGGQLAGATQA